MRPDPAITDQYSFYDYKPTIRNHTNRSLAPGWVPEEDRRRLMAYHLLAGYLRNNSRAWLPTDLSEDEINSRREYGDCGTIIDTVVSSVMGESQELYVEGAINEDPPIPEAVAQLEVLRQWAKDENFYIKMLENERTAAAMGDAVYVLGWDPEKARPRLRVYDPGFFFPVLDPEKDEEFPSKVHICYEFERKEGDQTHKYVRRITWELVDLYERIEDVETGTIQLIPKEEYQARTLPWEPTPLRTCLMSDGEWRLDDTRNGLVDLDESKARWKFYKRDLLLDFIPVVHLPNTAAGEEYFGVSSLARVLQIIDDLISTDTDLQAASATTGSPPIAINGTHIPTNEQGQIDTYGPGTVIKTGDGGATMIDTSRSLDALMKYDEHLLGRLSVNARIPESLLGRVKPNEVPSGIALTLSFTPHANMIKEMRLVREVKYSLLLKFVTRMFWLSQQITAEFPARVVFGTFLPADRQEASTLVTQLLRPDRPLISLQTAVEILVKAGFPIEDAAKEVRRIREEDFTDANRLFDATGDINLVYQRLGLSATAVDPQQVPPDESILVEEDEDFVDEP